MVMHSDLRLGNSRPKSFVAVARSSRTVHAGIQMHEALCFFDQRGQNRFDREQWIDNRQPQKGGDSNERRNAEPQHPQVSQTVGVGAQRAIEHSVAEAASAGAIAGTESFPATMTLEVAGLKLSVIFRGDITLQ